MTPLLLLVLCALAPSAVAQRPMPPSTVAECNELFQRSTYEFAVQLTRRVAQEKNNHFIISTFSMWALLATVSLGSNGNTLYEFRNVLSVPVNWQRYFNNQYFELVRSTAGGNVTLERSSSIFVSDSLRIKDGFLRVARNIGLGEVIVMSLDDPRIVASTIGQHVSCATHGKITDLVSPADFEDIVLVLIDALYFQGLWKKPFPYENTERKPFYDATGAQVGEVDMMLVEGAFNLSTVSLLNATVLELPFDADGRFAMLVFLPKRKTTLSAVIDSLSRVNLRTIYERFEQDYVDRVQVQLPRFELTSELDNLRELLGDMGLRAAFDRRAARFTRLSNKPLFISKVVQKATLSVSEAGAEASVVTTSRFRKVIGFEDFLCNKPFLYMIVDTVSQLPLFTGAYSQPS